MSVFSKTKSSGNESLLFDYFKGILIASLCSLIFVVVFAFVIKWFDIADGYLNLITLMIKALSVIIGAIFAVKGKEKGLVKGAVFGLIYVIVAFVIFSLLAGGFSLGLSFVLDLAFATLLGGIVGIIKVNRK